MDVRSNPSLSASESGLFSGILATRSRDSDEFRRGNEDNSNPSGSSSLVQRPRMISGRGALISGVVIPKADESDSEDDDDDEVEYDDGDDVENGIEPPDSDYASYAPPNLFERAVSQVPVERSKPACFPISTIKMNHTELPLESSDDGTELKSEEEKQPPRNLWCGLAIFSVLLLGAVTTVGVVVTRRIDQNPLTPRQQELSTIVTSLSDSSALDDKSSSRSKAHLWLINEDEVWTGDNVTISKDAVIQRYVLALFYFETSGSSWTENNWMIGPECSGWTGVTCNENGQARSIVLDRQGLMGTIPHEIGHLSLLESLVVKQDQGLAGSIPSSFGKLSNLRQLGLTNNMLVGSIPSELFLVSTLSYLNLESNKFTGTLSPDIGNLRNLRTLALSNNRFEGTIPFERLSYAKLEYLGLGTNGFSGKINETIRDFDSLRYLYLDHTELAGEIPVALGGAVNLRSLNLDYTKISGKIPAIIGRLRSLEYLSMHGCDLKGSIPGEINLLSKLRTLNLASNAFTGELPTLSSLTRLSSLMLANNKFEGRIDESFSDLKSLETLFLSSNAFTGPFPAVIGRGSGSPLRGLYLSENQLDGKLPDGICNLTKLEALFGDSNQLTGSIPACIGNLVDLKQFYVFKNKLSGELPRQMSALRKLTGIGIESNNFTGTVSSDVCALESNEVISFWSDCGGESPELTCPCCDVCCPSDECI